MGMSRVPLSTLYASVPQFLAERGGSVVLQAGVDAAEWNEQTAQWTLHARERVFPADFVIAALPFEAMGKLIAGLPAVASVDALAEKIALAHCYQQLATVAGDDGWNAKVHQLADPHAGATQQAQRRRRESPDDAADGDGRPTRPMVPAEACTYETAGALWRAHDLGGLRRSLIRNLRDSDRQVVVYAVAGWVVVMPRCVNRVCRSMRRVS